MSKKFTEEQYRSIVKAWQSENTYIHKTEAVIDYLIDELNLDVMLIGEQALALANPVTRELVYDDYVIESKFVWYDPNEGSVINTFDGRWYLDMHLPEDDSDEVNSKFTEKEIAESPFRADYFNKVEVTD